MPLFSHPGYTPVNCIPGEATGHTHWFEAMLAELGHELWMGDAAKIRAAVVRKQKTVAKVAIARKLAVGMYWMLRSTADYAQLVRMQGSPWATLVEKDSSLG